MSWKSIVSAGLLCVLASPTFADPVVDAVGGGNQSSSHLDDSSNWVWQFRVAPTASIVTSLGGTPLAAELGFTTSGTSTDIVSNATKNAADWDTDNPGTVIFGWEPPGPDGEPVGVHTNVTTDEVFSALGSVDFATTGPKNYVAITIERPIVTNPAIMATSTVNVVGAYPAAIGNGRIAELTGATTSANYDTYNGSVTRQAQGGDTNLDGDVAGADYSTVLANFNINDGARQWYHGDFNGDNDVAGADYSMVLANFNAATYTVLTDGAIPGGGAGSATATPEPASVALLALAGLGLAGLRFRRR